MNTKKRQSLANLFKTSGLMAVASLAMVIAFAIPAFAAPPPEDGGGSKDCGVETAFDIRCGNQNPIIAVMMVILNFLAVGVGIVVVGGIVWGSIKYITSNGNASQAQEGVTIITNSVIGLLLFIFMYAIVNFLIPGGLF